MPVAGDTFITTLKDAHLRWGSHRHTNSRGTIYGEGYLQIPAQIARNIGIYNVNGLGPGITNIYTCNSVDGYLRDVELKATGCSRAGNIYAKQFQGNDNLKLLGDWYNQMNAVVGDRVEIIWVNPNEISIELL